MQNSFDTSFIPQQPLLRVEGVGRTREPMNFALVLAFVVFFASLMVAGGIYFYNRQIEQRILASSLQLEQLEKTLASNDIALYKRVDSRITTTKALLRNHGVFSLVLDFLEQETAKNIGLTALSYTVSADNQIILMIRGVGPSFQAVYFQSETWKNAVPFVSQMTIDKVALSDASGLVDFEAKIFLNPEFLKYTKVVEAEAAMKKEQDAQLETTTIELDASSTTP